MAIPSRPRLPIVAFVVLGAALLALGGFAAGRASITAVTPTASPSRFTPSPPVADPTASFAAARASNPIVQLHKWPGARGGDGPGLYFWDMVGGNWMHNEGASLLFATDGTPIEGVGEPVMVAAHPAVHRAVPADSMGNVREQWIIQEIGNQTVFITMEYALDAEPRGIAEAREVIASLVLEEGPTPSGYMLVFALLGGWDSG